MKLPGIKTEKLDELGKEDTKAVLDHFDKVKEAIKKKKDLIEGKIAELTEIKPENEIKKLEKVLKDIQDKQDVYSIVKKLKEETERLLFSVKKEANLVEQVEEYEGTTPEELEEELENELIIGDIIEHQLNILHEMLSTSKNAIKEAVKLEEHFKKEVGNASENLNDMASFIVRIIFNEELPHLSVAYNLLKLDEWPEIEARLHEIRTRFEMLQLKEP